MAPVHKATWYQQQFPRSAGEMYMDLLCTRESQTREAPNVVPATVALPKSTKRSRAHDDVVILTGKRARKGPGYYTHLADNAPLEQEMAGDRSKIGTQRAPRRIMKVRRNTTQMACSGAGQGAAGAKRGRKPKVVDDPMEDALLIEHFCDSALSGGSNSSGSSAERTAKQETQLLQQPANAAESHGAMLTQPFAGQKATASFLAALIHVVFDSPQVEAPVAETVSTPPEPAAKAAAVKRAAARRPAVMEPVRRSVRLAASARAAFCEMQE